MSTNFGSRESIAAGRLTQAKLKETPSSFGTVDGASAVSETNTMDTGEPRMAGQEGMRALQMMANPDEAKRTNTWMAHFGMSNQGMMWNQAKMMGGIPPSPDQEAG